MKGQGNDRWVRQDPPGGVGGQETPRIHGKGETTSHLNEQEAKPKGDMVTLGSLHAMGNGVRPASSPLTVWRTVETVSTRLSPTLMGEDGGTWLA